MVPGSVTISSTRKQSNERRVFFPFLLVGISLVALYPLYSLNSNSFVIRELEQKLDFFNIPKEKYHFVDVDNSTLSLDNVTSTFTNSIKPPYHEHRVSNEAKTTSDPMNESIFQSKSNSDQTNMTSLQGHQIFAVTNITSFQNNKSLIQLTTAPKNEPLELENTTHNNVTAPHQRFEDNRTSFTGSLNCDRFGGPSMDIAQEMVYWREVPSDQPVFRSPFFKEDREQYLIFEPDEAGWNNVRMAFETVVGMAIAMGRTLVMPPKLHFSQVWDYGIEKVPVTVMGFEDYFDMNGTGLKVISFQYFLENVALKGKFIDINTGQPTFPPKNNLTNWNGLIRNYEGTKTGDTKTLFNWLRNVSTALKWNTDKCVAAFPRVPGAEGSRRVQTMLERVLSFDKQSNQKWWERLNSFTSNPTPVNASATMRLREILTNRRKLCIYDEKLQEAQVVHAYGEQNSGYRMLIHFYAFLFSANWKMDLYIKRFIRDRIRYVDQLHCAAARIVAKVRQIAKENGQPDGSFDSFHIRRNDFKRAYKSVVLTAEQIYKENTSPVIREKRTVYIATDEKDLSFFLPLREHYNLVFMKDFIGEIQDIIPNFYGLVDELVSARGDTFVGTYYSTFSGYINRLRGYFANRRDGSTTSYYSVPQNMKDSWNIMTKYTAISPPYWAREFPVCWRDIDHGFRKINGTRMNHSLNYTASN